VQCPADETLLALVEGQLDDETLRSIDSHLDDCALCREVVATLGSGPRQARARLDRADAVGRFLVIERIGEGAMGVVYAAYDPELDRRVALKLLRADRSDARARARLVREAQAMARLSHPHVVTVYDVGTRGDDVWVAMELVEGGNLRAWLEADRPTADVLQMFRQAGAGLAAAHAAGLVHRDFKPENVLVDADGVPKVGDFGLAVGEGDAPGEVPEGALLEASLTRTGALLGTPAYMAPEQLAGEAADARADQFAFCVALWEAIAGERPFEGATIAALRADIASGPPAPRFDARTATALRRGLSAKPGERFADMAALLDALSPAPRRPAGWLVVAGVSSLAVVGALVALLGDPPPAEDRCAASAEALDPVWSDAARGALASPIAGAIDGWATRWTDARVAACEATHVAHEQSAERMDRRMACLDRQRAALEVVLGRIGEGDDARAIDAVETLPAPEACAVDADVSPPPPAIAGDVAALRRRIDEGRVLVATAAHDEALARSDAAVTEATELGYPPALAEAHRLRADALRGVARFDEADAAAEASVLAAEAAGDDRGAAEGWLARARVAGARGRFDAAESWARHAAAAVTRAGDPVDLVDEVRHVRGVVRTNLGQIHEAEADLRAALASATERYGADSPRLASLHTSLGNLLRVDARYADALAAHERALALDEAALGEDHPRVGRDLHNVAGVLRRMDRADEAQARYERALAIKRAALGEGHPEVALTLNSLGLMARERGDGERARGLWERAVAIFDAHHHGDAALTRFNLALLALDEARWADAEREVGAAIALDSARIGPRSKRVGSEHVLLARARFGLGQDDAGRAAARVARDIGRALRDPPLEAQGEALLAAHPDRPSRPERRRRPDPDPDPDPAPDPDPDPDPAPTPDPDPARDLRRPGGSGSYGAGQAWE